MWHIRYPQVALLLLILTSILLLLPVTAHAQGASTFRTGDFALIIAKDNPIDLLDAPHGGGDADDIRVGALVQIDAISEGKGTTWYHVHSVTDRTRRGWVSEEVLKSVVGVRNHIGNIVTCSESANHGPICGATLPLTKNDALMFHFDYYGVERNSKLQWVITVGSEQYSSRLVGLERTEGAKVLNLLDMETLPHDFSGRWRITFYIDGQAVHERNMTILAPLMPTSPTLTPTPTATPSPKAIPSPTPIPSATPTSPWQSETIRHMP